MINNQSFPGSKRYKLSASHCGDAPEYHSSFFCDNDEEAKIKLISIRAEPSNGMDFITMDRIDVEETSTNIATFEPKSLLIEKE